MKINLLVWAILSLLLAGCNSAAGVCRTSCDDILIQFGRISNTLDEAALAARNADKIDDAGRVFNQYDDYMDDLSKLVQREVAVQERPPAQLTSEILQNSAQYSDELQRLRDWAQENQEGVEFVTNLTCAYRDAYAQSVATYSRLPTVEELGRELSGRYSNAPPSGEELQKKWTRIVEGINQNNINIWDTSISLYCILSELNPE